MVYWMTALTEKEVLQALQTLQAQGSAQPTLAELQQTLGRGTINQIARLKQLALSDEKVPNLPPKLLQAVDGLWQQMCDLSGTEPSAGHLIGDAWGQENLRLRCEQLENEAAQLRADLKEQREQATQAQLRTSEQLALVVNERNTLLKDLDNLRGIRDRLQSEISSATREADQLKQMQEHYRNSHEHEIRAHFERESLLQSQIEQLKSEVQRGDALVSILRSSKQV